MMTLTHSKHNASCCVMIVQYNVKRVHDDSVMIIAFMTTNNNVVLLIEGLCSSNPIRFEFSVFEFGGIEPTT